MHHAGIAYKWAFMDTMASWEGSLASLCTGLAPIVTQKQTVSIQLPTSFNHLRYVKVAIASHFERSCHKKGTKTALKTANTYTHTHVHAPHPLHDACTYIPIYNHAWIHECKTRRCPTHSHMHYVHDIRIQNRRTHRLTNAHMYVTHLRPASLKGMLGWGWEVVSVWAGPRL